MSEHLPPPRRSEFGPQSEGEQAERQLLGLPPTGRADPRCIYVAPQRAPVTRRAITALDVLNEAPEYASTFVRGLRVDAGPGATHLLLSGTASIGTEGETLYEGDFGAQCWRTYRNLTRLLEVEDANWHDVVRTSCYLRDIERDYDHFNAIRTEFFAALGLDPVPASTGIQARLCRSDLLIEIEAHAIVERG